MGIKQGKEMKQFKKTMRSMTRKNLIDQNIQLVTELEKIKDDLLNMNVDIYAYVSGVINKTLNKKNYEFTLDDACVGCLNPIQDRIKENLKDIEFLLNK